MYCVANGNSRKMKSNLRIWVVNGCPCYTPLSLSLTPQPHQLLSSSSSSSSSSLSLCFCHSVCVFNGSSAVPCIHLSTVSLLQAISSSLGYNLLSSLFFPSTFGLSAHLLLSMLCFIIQPFASGFDSCLAVDGVSGPFDTCFQKI